MKPELRQTTRKTPRRMNQSAPAILGGDALGHGEQIPAEEMFAVSGAYRKVVQRFNGRNIKAKLKGVQISDVEKLIARSGAGMVSKKRFECLRTIGPYGGIDLVHTNGKTMYFVEYKTLPDAPPDYPAGREVFREAVSLMYGVIKDVGPNASLSKPELLLKVSGALAAEANAEQEASRTAGSWDGLLLKGLERKKAVLKSTQFRSVAEAADVLGLKEPAVRRRIREDKLFALREPSTDEYRIPVWALALSSEQMREIRAASGEMDAWSLYHFMSTPNSWLNGLRPFELLLTQDSLDPEQLARRKDVAQHFGASNSDALLDIVLKALAQEVAEESEA
jgi:hypothetical protein